MDSTRRDDRRTFFLVSTPDEGGAELSTPDRTHARRVLRLRPGDELAGLDGRGGRWPLRVADTSDGRFEVEAAGPAQREPAPGEPGAPLPWIEVAVALPRERRAEAMLDRLVQLGVAAVTPLWTARSQGERREVSQARLERFERVAREACKQCGRSWLPLLHPTRSPAELVAERVGAALLLLGPGGSTNLRERAAELPPATGTRERPIVLVVGPEGGFSEEETAVLVPASGEPVGLGPHVLRIETAAEAGLAGLVQALFRA